MPRRRKTPLIRPVLMVNVPGASARPKGLAVDRRVTTISRRPVSRSKCGQFVRSLSMRRARSRDASRRVPERHNVGQKHRTPISLQWIVLIFLCALLTTVYHRLAICSLAAAVTMSPSAETINPEKPPVGGKRSRRMRWFPGGTMSVRRLPMPMLWRLNGIALSFDPDCDNLFIRSF